MRILITTQPALSHAGQLIPLARALREAGHTVTFASSASFVPVLRQHGLEARAFAPDWRVQPGDPVFDRTVGAHTFQGFPEVPSAASVEGLVAIAAEVRPDLVIREYSEFAGWALAAKLGLPLVTQGIIHRVPPPIEAEVVSRVKALASAVGCVPPESADDLLGEAYLDPVPPTFRAPWERPGPHVRAVRPSLFDGSGGEEPAWLAGLGDRRPLVYVTLGTIFNRTPGVWRALFGALGGLGVDALVTTGGAELAGAGAVPENVRVERYVPQSAVLPRCTAVVCHAGFNTLIGAFAHGLPVLCLPIGADQPVNAACCAASGAGINGANGQARDARGPMVDPETLSADELRMAIERLLGDPSLAAAAGRIRAEMAAMPAPAEVARLVEQVAVALR